MNINEALQLPDDSAVDTITITINKVGDKKPPKNAGWAAEWFCQTSDGTGKMGTVFKFKKTDKNPADWLGKTVTFTCGKDLEGKPSGIKVKSSGQYKNLHITDSAKVTIEGGTSAPASQSTTSRAPNTALPPSVTLPPDDLMKHFATEWCHAYDITKEIFETRVPPEQVKELVTGIVIEMRRAGISILPTPDRKMDWRNYVVQGTALKDLPPDKLRNGYVLTLQGKFKNPDTCRAFTEAFKESGLDHRSVYGKWLLKEGIDDDASDTVLLRHFKAIEDMTDEEFQVALGKSELFDEMKDLMAKRKTAFDDEQTSLD